MAIGLESGSGVILAEDGGRLLLEGEPSGPHGTIAASSTLSATPRIAWRATGTIAGVGTFTATRRGRVSGEIAGRSTLRAINYGTPYPDLSGSADALAAGVAPFRHVWINLSVDLGAGLVLIPNAKIGADLSITESLDNIADELQFTLAGEEFSPLANLALTGKRAVSLSLSYGGDGTFYEGRVFDGFLYSSSFDGRALHCIAHDAASQWIEKLVSPNVAAGSGRARVEIARQLLDGAGVPVSVIDVTPSNGGTIQKPVSFADVRLFDFLRDFLSPVDALMWFERGRLRITSVAQAAAAAATTVERNMIAPPVTIAGNPTNTPNVITVAAVKYLSDAGPDGVPVAKIVTTVVETYAIYAPVNLTALDDHDPAISRLISRVTTTAVYLGSTVVWQKTDEEAWYAPRGGSQTAIAQAGMAYQDASFAWHTAVEGQVFNSGDGTLSPIFPWSGYLFPDGTLRAVDRETFQLVRRTILNRILDTNNRIEKETTRVYEWHRPLMATYQVINDSGTIREALYSPTNDYVMLGDDGLRHATTVTLYADPETFSPLPSISYSSPLTNNIQRDGFDTNGDSAHGKPVSTSTLAHSINGDGAITHDSDVEANYGRGVALSPFNIGAFVYGTLSKEYWSLAEETRDADLLTTITDYTVITEDVHRKTEVQTRTGSTPVTTISDEAGPLPIAEQVSSSSTSQEISATVTDSIRVSLNGEITSSEHNEFCETVEELQAVAQARVRDNAAVNLTYDMPLEATIHKGKMVLANLHEFDADRAALVWSVTRNLSSFRQTVAARIFMDGTL